MRQNNQNYRRRKIISRDNRLQNRENISATPGFTPWFPDGSDREFDPIVQGVFAAGGKKGVGDCLQGKREWLFSEKGVSDSLCNDIEDPLVFSCLLWLPVKRIFRYLYICIGIMSYINLLQNIVFLPGLINRKIDKEYSICIVFFISFAQIVL